MHDTLTDLDQLFFLLLLVAMSVLMLLATTRVVLVWCLHSRKADAAFFHALGV